MADKLKIIPLGGLDEIGKNMTVYEYGGEIIIVDCGMGFPGDDMYGVDLVIPDVSYLVKQRNRIRGLFITHGHVGTDGKGHGVGDGVVDVDELHIELAHLHHLTGLHGDELGALEKAVLL